MTTKDEVRSTVEALRTERALKLALEALEECRRDPRLKYEHPYYDKTITALREALAAVPEPHEQQSAERVEPVGEITAEDMGRPFNAIRIGTHFYKEIPPVGTKLYTSPPASKPMPEDYTALELALTRLQKRYADLEGRASKPWVHATTWRGLTEEDANQLVEDCDWYNDPVAFCFDIEAKLKEKNDF